MESTTKDIRECVHCGAIGPVTRDHVPPKALFGKPRPALPTVVSCEACNGGASDDDEYFRAMLLMHDTGGDHPDAVANRAAFFRSLARPKKLGFRKLILGGTRDVFVVAPDGVAERRGAFEVEGARLARVATRVLRGMFYLKQGRRLRDEYVAQTALLGTREREDDEEMRSLLGPALASPSTVIGAGVLEYWVHFEPDPGWSIWLFRYYGEIDFLGLTLPKAEADKALPQNGEI
jgi:hypothetical protein